MKPKKREQWRFAPLFSFFGKKAQPYGCAFFYLLL